MHLAVIFLPLRFARGNAGGILDLVQQNIAVFGLFRDDVERGGIAADDNGLPVFCCELIAVAFECAVADGERLHGNTLVFVNNARFNLRRFHLITVFVRALKAVQAKIDIDRIGREQMLRHISNSLRAEDPQRFFPFQHPRGENEVRKPGGMVGMQMRTERGIEQIGSKGIFAAAVRFRCASYDAGAKIDEVRMAVDNDGGSRAARPRAGVWCARTE